MLKKGWGRLSVSELRAFRRALDGLSGLYIRLTAARDAATPAPLGDSPGGCNVVEGASPCGAEPALTLRPLQVDGVEVRVNVCEAHAGSLLESLTRILE